MEERLKTIIIVLLILCPALYGLHRIRGPLQEMTSRWSAGHLFYAYEDDVNDVNSIETVDDLTDFIAGDTGLSVTDDGDGTVTLDLDTDLTTWSGITPHASWQDILDGTTTTAANGRTIRDQLNIPFIDVTDYGATGDGTTDDTTAIQAAIDAAAASNGTVYGEGEFIISETLDLVGIQAIHLGRLNKATVFTGTELVNVTNDSDQPLKYCWIDVNGVDESVDGVLFDGPANGYNDVYVYGYKCDSLLKVNGNTEKCRFSVFGSYCNTFVELAYDNPYSPDENTFFINGVHCDTAFKQTGSSSATVQFNVEQTGDDGSSYAVDISGAVKQCALLGQIRAIGAGGVYVNSSPSAEVLFNGLMMYTVDVNPAVHVEQAQTISGYFLAQACNAGGLWIDNLSRGGVLNVELTNLDGGTAVRLGDDPNDVDGLHLTVNTSPINDTSTILDANCITDCYVEMVSAAQGGAGGVTLDNVVTSQIILPGSVVRSNRTIGGDLTAGNIQFNQTATTAQIAAFSTPLEGMRIYDSDKECWVVHQNSGWGQTVFLDQDVSPATAGELLYDNTVTGWNDGAIAWYDDDEVKYLVDLATLPSDDDYVVAYDADADGFYMKADAGAGAAGTVTTIETGDVQVGGADIVTIDFNDVQFNVAEDPDTEINIDVNEVWLATFAAADPNSHDAVTVTESASITLTLSGQDITADVNETYTDTLYLGLTDDANNVADADYGDITVSSGSWSIDANVVDSAAIADDAVDPNHTADDDWGAFSMSGGVATNETITVTDNEDTDEANALVFVADADLDGATDAALESDGDLTYDPNSGTLTATEFSGGGANLTAVDAATGDSATAFFDAGTVEHEYGGLEADVSGYGGLVGITGGSTVDVNLSSELLTAIDDETGEGVLAFATSPTFTTSILAASNADIGSAAAEFGDVYLGDGKILYLGDDQDVTMTHDPDVGVVFNLDVQATTFTGDGSALTAVDAATGDSATAFFDAGTIEHEWGGLQADVSSYTGLIAITGADTTAEIDAKSELEGQIADVDDFAEADGDTYSNAHDFSSATVTLPARAAGLSEDWKAQIVDPNYYYSSYSHYLILDQNTPAALTITHFQAACDTASEDALDWDLNFCDNPFDLADPNLIGAVNTSSGLSDITSFDDPNIPSGKCVYITLAAQPDADIKYVRFQCDYDYD